jgi:hypothetical protein
LSWISRKMMLLWNLNFAIMCIWSQKHVIPIQECYVGWSFWIRLYDELIYRETLQHYIILKYHWLRIFHCFVITTGNYWLSSCDNDEKFIKCRFVHKIWFYIETPTQNYRCLFLVVSVVWNVYMSTQNHVSLVLCV